MVSKVESVCELLNPHRPRDLYAAGPPETQWKEYADYLETAVDEDDPAQVELRNLTRQMIRIAPAPERPGRRIIVLTISIDDVSSEGGCNKFRGYVKPVPPNPSQH
ncbi:hypothetical protein [uncultured Nocardioides sp.]|uniref:hypothetical protein n=1 Tax=uncultured Nocardioides sp. TaxID=198441 RepID=UPI00260E5B3C|nr:hypothetical protein [uncultured Nocardioides sp.]